MSMRRRSVVARRRRRIRSGGGGASPTIVLSGASVLEDATAGTVIGLLSVLNIDPGGTFTITADPDNKFAIANDDELQVDGAFNFEVAQLHLVTIEYDNGVDDPIEQLFVITVLDVAGGASDGLAFDFSDPSAQPWVFW